MGKVQPRKKPTQARAIATYNAILRAAEELLVEDGFHNLSTNRIAEVAEVSIGSLYQYFSNKESVVAGVVDEFAERQFAYLASELAEMDLDAPMETSIRQMIRSLLESKKQEPELSKVLLEELPPVGQTDVLYEWVQNACGLVEATLQAKKDEIRPKNLKMAAYILVTACHGIIHITVIDQPQLLDHDDLAEETAELVLRYLMP